MLDEDCGGEEVVEGVGCGLGVQVGTYRAGVDLGLKVGGEAGEVAAGGGEQQFAHFRRFGCVAHQDTQRIGAPLHVGHLGAGHGEDVVGVAAGEQVLEGSGEGVRQRMFDAGVEKVFLTAEVAEDGDFVDAGLSRDGAGGGAAVADAAKERVGGVDDAPARVVGLGIGRLLGRHGCLRTVTGASVCLQAL